MSKEQEYTNRYDNELDYLLKSLTFVQERLTVVRKNVEECNAEMHSLKEDIPNIKTKRLLDAAMKTFNHFSMEKGNNLKLIKEIREDEKWIRKLIKIVRRRRSS
jgi:hypothetical protein